MLERNQLRAIEVGNGAGHLEDAVVRLSLIHIFGCGSARPTRHHLPAAQVLTISGHNYLIDAGEGVQHSLLMAGYKITQLEALFISHAHGDHCFGLPGLLTSMAHVGRTKPLTIVTTAEVADYIHYIEAVSYTHLDIAAQGKRL